MSSMVKFCGECRSTVVKPVGHEQSEPYKSRINSPASGKLLPGKGYADTDTAKPYQPFKENPNLLLPSAQSSVLQWLIISFIRWLLVRGIFTYTLDCNRGWGQAYAESYFIGSEKCFIQ